MNLDKSISYFFLILFLLISNQLKSQCPLLTGTSQLTAVNFPDTIDVRIDSINLEVTIDFPSSMTSSYNGKIIIIKEGGAFGPTRDLDTVYASLVPGTITNYFIKFPTTFFTEGNVFSNEQKAIALTFRGLDDPCNSSPEADASPELYTFTVINCQPFPLITVDNQILSSSSLTGNRWYLNKSKLVNQTNDTLYATTDGVYMLEVYKNGCHSFDTISFKNQIQCPLLSGTSQITGVNFPDTIDAGIDSINLEVRIDYPSSSSSSYSGRIIIVKEGGAFGPTRHLDTIYATLTPGSVTNYFIKFPTTFFTEGSEFSNEQKAIALTFRGLDDPCTSSTYADASAEWYSFTVINCKPAPHITVNNLTLSTTSLMGNRWYLNKSKIVNQTSDTLYATADGIYILEVYKNGCHSFDTIWFTGITYNGNGLMVVPFISGASYEWYKDNMLISSAQTNSFTASQNGFYKCVITFCPNCKKGFRVTTNQTATFYKSISDLTTTSINDKIDFKTISFFPNPVQNYLHLNNLNPYSNFQIIDLSGKRLVEFNNLESTDMIINLSELQEGFYIVKFYSEQTEQKFSFIKISK